jgi:uncharacterized protein YjbI with pentapeptide repeats
MPADRPFGDRFREFWIRRSPAFILGGRGLEKPYDPIGPIDRFLTIATRSDRPSRRYRHRRAVRLGLDGEQLGWWNLAGRDLSGIQITKGDLQRASLRETDLASARLYNVNLEGADLHRARLWHADLRRATLAAAEMAGVDLRGARLESADLRNADLRGANLTGARLAATDLRGADLREATLSADFDRDTVVWDERTRWPEATEL